jgi:hypothetical protein
VTMASHRTMPLSMSLVSAFMVPSLFIIYIER